jgi:hypothetical protein
MNANGTAKNELTRPIILDRLSASRAAGAWLTYARRIGNVIMPLITA